MPRSSRRSGTNPSPPASAASQWRGIPVSPRGCGRSKRAPSRLRRESGGSSACCCAFGPPSAGPRPLRFAAAGYRALGRIGLVPGSSDASEVAGTERPERFLKGLTDTQARAGLAGIGRIDRDNAHRRAIAEIYHRALERMGLPRPAEPPHAVHTFLKYPVFPRDRDRLLRLAASRGIALSDWFRSPIHPVTAGWERWLYEAGISSRRRGAEPPLRQSSDAAWRDAPIRRARRRVSRAAPRPVRRSSGLRVSAEARAPAACAVAA